jgi:alkaline phosphatase D
MKQNGGAVILSGVSNVVFVLSLVLAHSNGLDRILTFSQDRHEHATTKFPPKTSGDKPVIEFSTSPLNQFYEPFDRFHKEIEDTDISLYSYPWGTSKFGRVTFDTSDEGRFKVYYELVVDGVKVWELEWELESDQANKLS